MTTPAVTEVSISSNALARLGDDPITSMTDATNRARLCNRLYYTQRDAELRGHKWNFALTRQELAQLSDEPEWEYAAKYQLPTNLLRLVSLDIEESGYAWKIEGRELLTDAGEVNILYVARIEDPTQFDALFTEALTLRLARALCRAITGKGSYYKEINEEYREVILQAKGVDAVEDYPQIVESSVLVDIRN